MSEALHLATILERLRDETAHQHRSLEAHLPLLDPTLTRPMYAELLRRFWGYYDPIEEALLTAMQRGSMDFDYASRLKTPLLENDLNALGEPSFARLRCTRLPTLAMLPQLLGSLYVIEGSTLGGQVITRHLAAHLGLRPESGCGFFNGYGPATGPRWRSFRAFLTEAAGSLDQDDLIVAGANDTFETLEAWLSHG